MYGVNNLWRLIEKINVNIVPLISPTLLNHMVGNGADLRTN